MTFISGIVTTINVITESLLTVVFVIGLIAALLSIPAVVFGPFLIPGFILTALTIILVLFYLMVVPTYVIYTDPKNIDSLLGNFLNTYIGNIMTIPRLFGDRFKRMSRLSY